MCNHEWCRHDFKAIHTLHRRLLRFGERQLTFAFVVLERFNYPAQYLNEIRASTAAGIEHVDARVGEAVGDAEFVAQDRVDARNHVLDDFRRGIPHTECLA